MKRFLTPILLGWMVLSAVANCGGAGNEETRRLSRIGKALGLDLSAGILLRYEDSHGGFHSDGLTTAEIGLDGLDEGRLDVPGWKPLPMSENAAKALYNCLSMDGATDTAVEQGWYYLYDRHSESIDPYDDTELCGRYSWNFTMGIYDRQLDQLYFYELDI